MKPAFLFVCCSLIATICYGRNYFHEENLPNSRKFFIFENENGKKQLINLVHKIKNVKVNLNDVRFYLYTQRNKNDGIEIKPEEFDGTIDSNYYNASTFNFFCTHGYSDDYKSQSNIYIKNAILDKHDVNVFLIDWSSYSKQFYTYSVLAIPQLGKIAGEFIEDLMSKYNIQFDDIGMTGHSIGAHLIGAAGAHLNGNVNYIVGIDPALPLFSLNETDKRLDISDAKFVHIIHSNSGLQGFRSSIGHADYFPNGNGMNQPGCGPDLFGACAHGRAYLYYTESISKSGFLATACGSYEDYKNGLCSGNKTSYMGEFPVDKTCAGDYYLDTASSSPYALNGNLNLENN